MENSRRFRRGARKIKDEPSFELVNIKAEPDDDSNDDTVDSSLASSTAGKAKRRHTRSRAVQVKPEDIDEAATPKLIVPSIPGENEPIDPAHSKTEVPQCRLCLRRVSRANLNIILTKHKSKTLAALKIKIFPNDAYPLACSNCLNLLDIILDFREAVTKAKNLLLSEGTFLESDGWDDSDCVEAIAKCRTVVEQHRNQINCIYQKFIKRENGELETDNAEYVQDNSTHLSLSDDHSIIAAAAEAEESSEYTDSVKPEPIGEHVGMTNVESEPEFEIDFIDEADESDFSPSSDSNDKDFACEKPATKSKKLKESKVHTPKVKKSNESTKKSKSYPKSKQKQELCDLCGQQVFPLAAEAHKNRHLGIKPYSCPAEGCELTFYSRINQTDHVRRIHSANGVPSYKCDICGRTIRGGKSVFNYHKRKHQHSKSHVCQFCGKGFTLRQYLKQHVTVVHTEVFPHECKYCGKKFKLKWSMLAHEKNVHEKKNQTFVTVDQQIPSNDLLPDTALDYA
ncbi:zinc finger protein 37-like [Sabethes cyaneus]|uniref:zinc finger protein 37-like n=1 Tax=Sabethes cyaneus TaxID=53552 RepID=UPI00237D92B1|nr:zinc finger protein 37-like [Sabethes cyaneus]